MENIENTEIKNIWFVRGDEKLFNEWKALRYDVENCAGIVQNDMEFCKEMLFSSSGLMYGGLHKIASNFVWSSSLAKRLDSIIVLLFSRLCLFMFFRVYSNGALYLSIKVHLLLGKSFNKLIPIHPEPQHISKNR